MSESVIILVIDRWTRPKLDSTAPGGLIRVVFRAWTGILHRASSTVRSGLWFSPVQLLSESTGRLVLMKLIAFRLLPERRLHQHPAGDVVVHPLAPPLTVGRAGVEREAAFHLKRLEGFIEG